MHEAVVCIVPSEAGAASIVDSLCDAGFSTYDISALLPEEDDRRELGCESTKAPEGAVAGASAGAVVGGTLGLLAGIGTLAIPGLGPFIVAGPIMSMLSGAAVGGGVGGVTGALIGMGIPEDEAKQYEGNLRAGNILLSVHTHNAHEAKRAEQLFREGGARNIKSSVLKGSTSK
jgi:uncharacterized membrane protein